MYLPCKKPMYKGICYGVRGKLEKEAWTMNEIAAHWPAVLAGFLFCLPACVILLIWFLHDRRADK
jgi:hypothetical protein